MRSIAFCIVFLFPLVFSLTVSGQKSLPDLRLLTSGIKTSIRGLSVVTDNVLWVSGTNGTIGKSTNGGKNWKWMTVKGFEKTDFRDIEAFNATTAIIMAVAEPAFILKTNDGGETWKVVYENKTKGMFLDAMEFWNEQAGIVIGDPLDGKFFIARTFDGGDTWREIPSEKLPKADAGEACFAASGTNIRALDRDEAVFVTGGMKSRLFTKADPIDLPFIQGKQTIGANSIAVFDNYRLKGGSKMVIVGGDFNADSSSRNNCFYSHNRGKTWQSPTIPPHGYRSCVEYISKRNLLACGLTGIDYSLNGGKDWVLISKDGFHVCRRAKSGNEVYLAGANGRVAKLVWR